MEKRHIRSAVVLAVFLVLFLLASNITLAAEGSKASNGFQRIGEFFKNKEFTNYTVLVDFGIFFLIFFSMCWLGLSRWFGEGFGKPGQAKGAVVGLSLGLSLMFTFGLVVSGKFTIAKTFPIAKNFLFLAFWLVLYAILSNNALIGSDTFLKKAIAFILAGIIIYVLANIATAYVCSLENNGSDAACQGGIFTVGKTFVEGIFGGLGGGGGGGLNGGGGTTPVHQGKRKGPGGVPSGPTCLQAVCEKTGICPDTDCRLAVDRLESTTASSIWNELVGTCSSFFSGPDKAQCLEFEKWRFVLENNCKDYSEPTNVNHSDYLNALGGYHFYKGKFQGDDMDDLKGAVEELSEATKFPNMFKDRATDALANIIRTRWPDIQTAIKQERTNIAALESQGKYTEAAAARKQLVDNLNILMGKK